MPQTKNQQLPVLLTFVVFAVIAGLYFIFINLLNVAPGKSIQTSLALSDVLFGLTIYLKTSVDFGLLMGLLMKQYTGVKNRIAIETGTALGNALGTMAVLFLWYFFKEIHWLLALMVLFASLVLLKLAQTSLEHLHEKDEETGEATRVNPSVLAGASLLEKVLKPINKITSPVLSRVMPELSFKSQGNLSFWGLLLTSITIPFILGTDDFAGYVPLFTVVNVYGFGIGVFLGHMILNIFLFLNPSATIKAVKNPIIGVIGSVVFFGLAIWGLYEGIQLLGEVFLH